LVLLILTAVADSKAAKKRNFSCNRASKLLDKCRKGGYEIGNCVAGDGKLKKRLRKRCTRVEKKFKAKCGEYQCEQQISQGDWKQFTVDNAGTETAEIPFNPDNQYIEVKLKDLDDTSTDKIGFHFNLNFKTNSPKSSGVLKFLHEKGTQRVRFNTAGARFCDDTKVWSSLVNGNFVIDILKKYVVEDIVNKKFGDFSNCVELHKTNWERLVNSGEINKMTFSVGRISGDVAKKLSAEYRIVTRIVKNEWTPIFNSTTERYDIGDFHMKFTQHKPADKFLYLAQEVVLYNSEGTRLGLTNFMFYLNPTNGKVQFSGYKRFYLGETLMTKTCSTKLDLPYLDDANFEMITSARSADMFQFKVSGELHTETMGDCKAFGDWQEAMKQATKMEMILKTTKNLYLPDYFSTEYKVVN